MNKGKERRLGLKLNKRFSVSEIKKEFKGLLVAVRDFDGASGVPVEFIDAESTDLDIWLCTIKSLPFKTMLLTC